MEIYQDKLRNIFIQANELCISETSSFGRNIRIDVRGIFSIGNRSRLGNDVEIKGHHILIGDDLYHSSGLRVGMGGHSNPDADLIIGNRCTIHNNNINIAKPVVIGNDVGLSPDVAVITHGYWLSVLEGFPAVFAGVTIDDGVIVGYRSTILMGIHICKNIVIGAESIITKDLNNPGSIYAGNPARFLRKVIPLSQKERKDAVSNIIEEYRKIATYHGLDPLIRGNYPIILFNKCRFDVEKLEFSGNEDIETDDFRDYMRKWGLRFYSNRPFRSAYESNS